MSEVQAITSSDVRQAIAHAAQATGVNFDFLLAQAKLESSLNPQARAETSSAAGLYQFIGSTWLETLDRHGATHGLDWADSAISDGRDGTKIVDRALRSQIMELRYDANTSSLMAAELTKDNQTVLRDRLGREPDFAELYMAHFLGAEGASSFLAALQRDPDSSAAALFPKQAAANRLVFYDVSGSSRSLAQVMDNFRQRLDRAMEDDGSTGPNYIAAVRPGTNTISNAPRLGPLAREFHETSAEHSRQSRVPLVETLRETFAGTDNQAATMPDNVKAAYAKLKAYNL